MTRLEALEVMSLKVGEVEDFLQGDKNDKTVGLIDPGLLVEQISRCVDGCQDLIKWAAEERKREVQKLSDPDAYGNDETFESEDYSGADEAMSDAGHSRGDF